MDRIAVTGPRTSRPWKGDSDREAEKQRGTEGERERGRESAPTIATRMATKVKHVAHTDGIPADLTQLRTLFNTLPTDFIKDLKTVCSALEIVAQVHFPGSAFCASSGRNRTRTLTCENVWQEKQACQLKAMLHTPVSAHESTIASVMVENALASMDGGKVGIWRRQLCPVTGHR